MALEVYARTGDLAFAREQSRKTAIAGTPSGMVLARAVFSTTNWDFTPDASRAVLARSQLCELFETPVFCADNSLIGQFNNLASRAV